MQECPRPEATPGEETGNEIREERSKPFILGTATMLISIDGLKPFMVQTPTPSPVQEETEGPDPLPTGASLTQYIETLEGHLFSFLKEWVTK